MVNASQPGNVHSDATPSTQMLGNRLLYIYIMFHNKSIDFAHAKMLLLKYDFILVRIIIIIITKTIFSRVGIKSHLKSF